MANKAFVVKHGLNPSTDNSVDLGTSSLEFKDLYIDGTAFLDAIGFGSVAMTLPTDHGINGQVLKTNGSNALAWANDTAGTITALNNQTEDRLVTIGSTTTQLDGEADLTFDGTTLNVVGNAGVGIARTEGTLHVHTASAGSVSADANHDDLVVENSGNVGQILLSPDANYSRFSFGSPSASGGYATIFGEYNSGSPYLAFNVNGGERFRIDSSGNLVIADGGGLVIGHTAQLSPVGYPPELQVLGTGDADSQASFGRWNNGGSGCQISIVKSRGTSVGAIGIVQDNDQLGLISWQGDDGTTTDSRAASIDCFVDGTPGENQMPGRLEFMTNTGGSGTGPVTSMTIGSNAKVGIGITSPACKLQVNNSTSGARGLGVRTSVTNDFCMDVTQSSSGFALHVLQLQTANGGSGLTGFDFLNCHDTSTDKAWIRGDGTYGSATNSYGSTSDSKLKQDVVDARKDYWDDFKQVRFRKFRLKDQVAIDSDAPSLLGVVAQEIESIFPSLVTDRPDRESTEVAQTDGEGNPLYVQSDELDEDGKTTNKLDDEGNPIPLTEMKAVNLGTKTKVVKYSILNQIGLCVVQELQTRLEAAEAKIAALEAA